MYAVLSKLNSVSRNIVTVEDPVEYRLPGINQVASDNEHGLGFANALKYIMRQDPDVIMVGEIRDHETASTAVQAALTGHLLISTLHANDAIGAVARLERPGRRQLQDRRRAAGLDRPAAAAADLHASARSRSSRTKRCSRRCARIASRRRTRCIYRGRGCKKCLGTGYSGRIPIYEIMVVTPALAEGIENGLPATKLRQIAHGRRHGRTGRRRHGTSARRPHDAGRSVLQVVELNVEQSSIGPLRRATRPTHD